MSLSEAISRTIAEFEAAALAENESLRRLNAELVGTVKEQRAMICHLLTINERVCTQRDKATEFNNLALRAQRDLFEHKVPDDEPGTLAAARRIAGRGNGSVQVRGEQLPQTEPIPQGIMPRAE